MRRVATLLFAAVLAANVPALYRADTGTGGSRHTAVVTPGGTVWTWGGNSHGQLGDGTVNDRRVPGAVSGLTDIVAVAAGDLHTLALKSDGSVWAWGYNGFGQLGDGTSFNRSQPVIVSNLSGVVAIAAGTNHSVALASNGVVYTWGQNTNGQLGDGSTTNNSSALMVTTISDIVSIGAGGSHTLAVEDDGTAWAWGLNSNGQLGDATTAQRTQPVQVSGVSTGVAVAGGQLHSLFLLSDGTVKASGSNSWRQIGDGTATQRTTPVSVSSLTGATAIAAGQLSSYALKSDGTVWAWGSNSNGRLGDGTTTTRDTPTQATSLSSVAVLGAGREHALAVTSAGVVWTWGTNTYGQLGDGTTESRVSPISISGPDYDWKVATPVFSVASGTYSTERTVVVTDATPDATIHYTTNGVTPTELDATITSGGSLLIDQTTTLKAKAFKSGMPASDVASATYTLSVAFISFSPSPGTHTTPKNVALSTSSPGVTVHYTTDGSTPTGASAVYASPISVATTTTIKALGVRTGWTSSSVSSGTFTMNFGTLAAPSFDPPAGTYISSATVTLSAMAGATIRYTTNGTSVSAGSPIYTSPLDLTATTAINARAYHPDYTTSAQSSATFVIAVATPELSHTSGTYTAGQVVSVATATPGATLRYTLSGLDPTAADPVVPAGGIHVGNFTLKVSAWKAGCQTSAVVTATYTVTGTLTVPRVAAGGDHSLAVREDGTFWTWGANSSGQLGDGTIAQRALPVLVGGVTGAVNLDAGGHHSLAVVADGTSVAWGSNGNGRLGDGTTTQRTLPTVVPSFTGTVALSGGTGHTLALRSDGSVWSWGLNSSGQLGDGTTTQRLSPVQATGLANITGITGGGAFSLAVAADGSVWSWGTNGNGQLGTGNTTSRTSAGTVSGITTATAVAAGEYHSLALLADGTVRSWGYNAQGQLGDGTTTQQTSPVTVVSLSNIVAIAAGQMHALAVASDGTVWAWGSNGVGQLGDGTTTSSSTPTAVGGLPAIVSVAAGNAHSLAVGADGSVWAWGRNVNGQLGDGTTTNRLTPVQVAEADMVWKVPTPTLSLASGLYTTEQAVVVTSGDPGATLHYTTNGTDPTPADSIVLSGGSLPVPVSLTLKVRAWKPGAVASEVAARTYELKVTSPGFSPGTGAYGAAQNVMMSTPTPGATITYSVDGVDPHAGSTAYTAPVGISDTRTVKARAFKAGWTASDVGIASYWIDAGTVATPTITPEGGDYDLPLLVTLTSATAGATIRYTADGTIPGAQSPAYRHPFLVSGTTEIKARAFLAGHSASAVATEVFAFDDTGLTGAPTILPSGGRFTTRQTVLVSGPSGADLRYTTNGIDPTETDTQVPVNGEITISRSTILKVRSWATGLEGSRVARADFQITGAVSAGFQHSLALGADGVAWGWGPVDGTLTPKDNPVSMLSGVVAVAGGQAHALAVKDDGTVWAWGANGSGQLGDGTTFVRMSPVAVSTLTGVVAVAGGYGHSLALKADGTVWAWGGNSFGQLGDGTSTARLTPVQVPGLKGVTSIAAGQDFSLAVQPDGAGGGFIWAWGKNAAGQLGDGTTTARLVPVRLPDIVNATQVAAGQSFGVARLDDGTVAAWGANDSGQVGDLGGPNVLVPQAVPHLEGATAVAAGVEHALALDEFGRVWGWGRQDAGRLGQTVGTSEQIAGAPRLIPAFTPSMGIAAGQWHSLALKADGTIWAAGSGTATGLGPSGHLPAAIPSFSLVDNAWLMDDADGDGLASWEEYFAGTDPLNVDSNGNGVSDSIDVRRGSEVTNPDDDGDGVPNVVELAMGTDPFNPDTDGDGYSDLVDAFPLDPTRHEKPAADPEDTTPPIITLLKPSNATPVSGGGGGVDF